MKTSPVKYILIWLMILLLSCQGVLAEGFLSPDDSLVYAKVKARLYTTASETEYVVTVYPGYPLIRLGSKGNCYHVRDYLGEFEGYVKKISVSSEQILPYEIDPSLKLYYRKTTSSTVIPKAVISQQKYLSSNMGLQEYKDFLVYIAECKVGCRYSHYADDETTFNNVSFVETCLGELGYVVNNNVTVAGHQGEQEFVARKDLQKGDVVFFATDNDMGIADHMGIYIGKGYFAHCSPVAGAVLVSYLDSGFYAKTLLWGRRYLDK
jgi:Cell wall-associated hydrolases (invasion-associated proteins)